MIAAEQYASRLVVPQSQRSHPSSWSSRKDHAAKALNKLAGPHLPGSLRQLEAAVKRAHEEAVRVERHACETQPAGLTAETQERESSDLTEGGVPPAADGENCDDEDLAESATA